MGQLASALGVVPGTATTMVKALAESGLVEYEPYSGVALTPAGRQARRARAAAPSPRRALPRPGDGLRVGRGARRGRTARTRRLGSADRPHGRDARTARGRSARRPDPRRRRPGEDAGGAEPDDVPDRHAGDGDARRRSGQRVPALSRAPPPQARRRDSGRGARRLGRQRARARRGRPADHDRHAGGVEAAGAGGAHGAARCCSRSCRRSPRTPTPAAARAAHQSLGLHGLPLQQARVQRRRRSTSTASCCWSRTRSAIASASSASSRSSTRWSRAARRTASWSSSRPTWTSCCTAASTCAPA